MGEMLSTQKAEARKLGWQAVAGWALTVLLVWEHWSIILVVAGGALAVWLTRRWFAFRAKWGMRF